MADGRSSWGGTSKSTKPSSLSKSLDNELETILFSALVFGVTKTARDATCRSGDKVTSDEKSRRGRLLAAGVIGTPPSSCNGRTRVVVGVVVVARESREEYLRNKGLRLDMATAAAAAATDDAGQHENETTQKNPNSTRNDPRNDSRFE